MTEWMVTSLQILYDIHYKGTSGNDIGTMFSNMNVTNIVNAKTSNVLDNFNSCKEYVNMETDAFIVAAALKYFGMESLETCAEEVIPPNIMTQRKQDRRIWLHGHVKNILQTHVMDEQQSKHTEIREGVEQAARPPLRALVSCFVCGKEYWYRKALVNHLDREHAGHSPIPDPEEMEQPRTNQSQSSEELPSDDRFNYACVRLGFGLLLRNFDDAVKEGDGERIIRCWKMSLLIWRAYGHTKYAYAAFHLIAATQATLTPHQAHCLIWNRTVNNKGGPGRNISMDIRVEHLNNFTKCMLKGLGPNLTENAARRCSKSVGKIEALLQTIDDDLNVCRPSGHHKVRKSETDFKTLVDELHRRAKMFHFNPSPQRQYIHFPHFKRDILSNIDHRLLNNWLTRLKKDLARSME